MQEAELKSTHHRRSPSDQLMLRHELSFNPEVPRPFPDLKVEVIHGGRGAYASVTTRTVDELVFTVADLDVFMDALREARAMLVPAGTVRVLPTGTRVPLDRGAA